MLKGIFTLYDKDKQEIGELSMLKLPFHKEELIKKSEKDFNEPEPCIIYETLCRNKLGMELKEKIETTSAFDFLDINDDLLKNLQFEGDVFYVKIK